METKELVGIILLLIIAFVFALILSKMIGYSYSAGDREACRMSVLAKWAGKKVSFGTVSNIFDLNCKTQQVEITTDSIVKNDKKVEDLKDLKEDQLQEKVERAIANEMYDCWYEFNRGQFDYTREGFQEIERDIRAHVCVVCSDVSFDEGIRKNLPEINGFTQWLSENKPEGTDVTYYDYFTNNMGNIKEDLQNLNMNAADSVKTEESYQVIFMVDKGTTTGGFLLSGTIAGGIGGIIGGAIGGAVIGFFVGGGVGAIPGAIIGAKLGGVMGVGLGAATGGVSALIAKAVPPDTYVPVLLFVPTQAVPDYCKKYY